MNILIIRFSSIGDIILTTAFIRQVRHTYPDARIDFIIKESFAELIRYNPHLDNIYAYNSTSKLVGLRKLRSTLKNIGYQFIFDLQNNFRSNYLLKAFPKAQKGQIDKLKVKRALLVFLKINLYNKSLPVPKRYLKTGKSAGIKDDNLGLELFLGNDITIPSLTGNFITLAPGAAHFTKRWPLDKFKKLINKIIQQFNTQIVLLGGKEDTEAFTSLEINNKVINLTGKLSILESSAMIKESLLLISNDSSLMHIATAVNTPVLALFGSTSEELGFFPYRGKSRVIQNEGLWCRPCTHIGRTRCPLGHFKCMKEIHVDDVFNGISQLVKDRF